MANEYLFLMHTEELAKKYQRNPPAKLLAQNAAWKETHPGELLWNRVKDNNGRQVIGINTQALDEHWARINHGQSFAKLNMRNGVDPAEAYCILTETRMPLDAFNPFEHEFHFNRLLEATDARLVKLGVTPLVLPAHPVKPEPMGKTEPAKPTQPNTPTEPTHATPLDKTEALLEKEESWAKRHGGKLAAGVAGAAILGGWAWHEYEKSQKKPTEPQR